MNLWTINAGHDLSAHINDRHTLLSRAAGHITRREPIAAYIHLLR